MSCNYVETYYTEKKEEKRKNEGRANEMFVYKFAQHLATFTRGNGGTFPVKGTILVDFRWRGYKYKTKNPHYAVTQKKETITMRGFSSTIDKKETIHQVAN